MCAPGYLQDLVELIEETQAIEPSPKLMNDRPLDRRPTTYFGLSQSTFAAMVLLNESGGEVRPGAGAARASSSTQQANQRKEQTMLNTIAPPSPENTRSSVPHLRVDVPTSPKKYRKLTARTKQAQFTPMDSDTSELEISAILSPRVGSSGPSLFDSKPDPFKNLVNKQLYSNGKLSAPSKASRSPSPSPLPLTRTQDVRPTNMVPPSIPDTQAPTLATRTTKDVIAELKGLRFSAAPAPVTFNNGRINYVFSQSSISSTEPIDLPELAISRKSVSSNLRGPDQEDNEDEDEVSEDETTGVRKPRKITERKRRQHAVADQFMNDINLRLAKEGIQVRPEDEDQQSTKWLVNQSENRNIISSPREYQTELFNIAKERNTIAVLDTGSGKTLIAVMLLRHVFEQELEDRAIGRQKRISFFLVDSVQLVFQQHAVLKANLDQPMNMFCGEMGCDLWNKEAWAKHFNANMVIVCTAEVLRQCLHHSFINISQINLLIFDEAHHAKKNHSYACIIKDFYARQLPGTLLPRIFGMTASPVDARTDVTKAAAELEGLLHCQIATAADSSLLKHSNACHAKLEEIASYDTLGPKFETPLYKKMKARFENNTVLFKPLKFSYEASQELGSWCSDHVWQFCLDEEEVKKLQAKTERHFLKGRTQVPLAVLEEKRALIEEARQIIKAHDFEPPHLDDTPTSRNLSSKVIILVDYLQRRFERKNDDKCIVFVEKRYTARVLAQLCSHPAIKTPYLRVGILVGTRTGGIGDLDVSFRNQVLAMAKFRKGEINCLFATSVAEEGLDVPDCNLVIRFDLYKTLIQYIQSRGRARRANSKYIHMIERNNREHQEIIKEVRHNANKLKRFCEALPEDRKLTGNDFNMDYFLAKESRSRIYSVPSTGAMLNYKTSLAVLANFVDRLPQAQEENFVVEYIMTVVHKQFVCETNLPEKSPVRGAVGRPASTKQVAKCSAAFETCLKLIEGKYVDEYLVPIFTKQLPAMRNALLAVDSKKREAYIMRTKPKMWSIGGIPETLFVTVLKLDTPEVVGRPSQPLALITRGPIRQLPSFYLHFGADQHSLVDSIPLQQALLVSSTSLNQINNFTLRIFYDVFSKLYETNLEATPYFLAPIRPETTITSESSPNDVISWDILQVVYDYEQKWDKKEFDNKVWQSAPDEYFADKYIVDRHDGSRKFWTVGVTKEHKPLDPVPPDCAPRRHARYNTSNILEYSISLWAKSRSQRTFDPDQRVIEAEYISLNRNLLDEYAAPNEERKTKAFLVMEPLIISPLPTTVVAMAYIFPAIIHRVESYLIALEACELLHLDIRPDLALEACTKDSDNSDEHDKVQVNFQRGMGNNYERLEFLGDCFLKMATSISLFGTKPENNEFEYHVFRMMLICNKNLKNNAVKLKLYEYIRSAAFNRRAWYPEGLTVLKGKLATARNTHDLGDKSIADVCESLIGAALLTHHESGNMDNAVRAVTELVSGEDHRVTQFSDYYKLYKKPKYQTSAATEMQKNIALQVEQKDAYHFKYPRLLRSAFTHPSYPFSYEHIPCYQRLEFLGDSLLDMVCVNFLFHNFPTKDPQWLTEHKMAMVSNQFLGALCVHLGFHTHLLLFNAKFIGQITNYVADITEARETAEQDAIRDGKRAEDCARDYWIQIQQPPKCLPDLVEAYIGAIFVDSEYNYSEVQRFFDTHIKWYFEDMRIYDCYANKHPTTFLTSYLQQNIGCENWTVMNRDIPSIDGSKPIVVALVIVHGLVIADAQAESSRYAKIAAAKKAMKLLDGLGLPEFREKYGCDCSIGEVKIDGEEDVEDVHGTAI